MQKWTCNTCCAETPCEINVVEKNLEPTLCPFDIGCEPGDAEWEKEE